MTNSNLPTHGPKCNKCEKIVTPSMAHTFECEDYLVYFCGPDCYNHWVKHHEIKHEPICSEEPSNTTSDDKPSD